MTSLGDQPDPFLQAEIKPARRWLPIITIGLGLVSYGGLIAVELHSGTLRGSSTPYTLAWYSLAFIVYLAGIIQLERWAALSLRVIFAGAVIFRLLLLITVPTLSDDIYRYLWDGYIATQGISPYAYPIDSPVLDYLDTPQRALANNRWMASPYLPAAQYLFVGLAWLNPASPRLFQLAMVLLDIMNGILLVKLLKIVSLPVHRVILYLWSPLVIVEVAHGAHVDTWMVFLTLVSLWLTFTPKVSPLLSYLAPVFLSLATLTKGLPVLLLAVLFWRWRWRQLILYGLVITALVIPVGLRAGWGLTGPMDGTGLFGAIRIYADQWTFNSGLFFWLSESLRQMYPGSATQWAKRAVGTVMLVVVLGTWLLAQRAQATREMFRLMAIPFMAYLLLTPTVHPWYLLPLLALIPFQTPDYGETRWRWLATLPWLYLSWAIALSYLTYLDPLEFRELGWVRRIEWWGTWTLLGTWMLSLFGRKWHQGRSVISG